LPKIKAAAAADSIGKHMFAIFCVCAVDVRSSTAQQKSDTACLAFFMLLGWFMLRTHYCLLFAIPFPRPQVQ